MLVAAMLIPSLWHWRATPTGMWIPKIVIARDLRKAMLDDGVVRDPRTETALAQKNAERRTRVLLEMKRIRNLKDDEKEAPRYLGEKLLEFLKPPAGGGIA